MDCSGSPSQLLSIALTFFLVANPVGNVPTILSQVKDFDFYQQRRIILREALFALLLALFFQYFGDVFLNAVKVSDYAVTMTGGSLLFMVALGMIFSVRGGENTEKVLKKEPFIVPIATPIISGPGLLAIIMLYAKQENNNLKISAAILIAWAGVFLVMGSAPYLQRIIGKRGLAALEQIMGMLLALMSMQMIVKGMTLFVKTI